MSGLFQALIRDAAKLSPEQVRQRLAMIDLAMKMEHELFILKMKVELASRYPPTSPAPQPTNNDSGATPPSASSMQ